MTNEQIANLIDQFEVVDEMLEDDIIFDVLNRNRIDEPVTQNGFFRTKHHLGITDSPELSREFTFNNKKYFINRGYDYNWVVVLCNKY